MSQDPLRHREVLLAERCLTPPAVLIEVEDQRVDELQHRADEEAGIAGHQREDARDGDGHDRRAAVGRELVGIELRGVLLPVVTAMVPTMRRAIALAIVVHQVVVDRVDEIPDEEKSSAGEGCREQRHMTMRL